MRKEENHIREEKLTQVTGGGIEAEYSQCEYRVNFKCTLSKSQRTMEKCNDCPARSKIMIIDK